MVLITAELTPEKILSQSDAYLIEHQIAKTANHLRVSDAAVLRKNAERAVRFRQKQGKSC